jgi:hypothetical protein
MSTTRTLSRRKSVAVAVALSAALSTGATTVGTTETAQAAGTSSFTIYGHPHSPSGRIGKGAISFFVHASGKRVGYGRVKNGLMVAHIKRSKTLRGMASNHGGMINLDMAIKKGRKLFMHGIRLRYANRTDTLGNFRMARVSYRSGSARTATADRLRTTLDGVHTFAPVLMFVPHGPDEATHYEFTSEGSTSAEIGYGFDIRSFHASGSMEVANNNVGKADGTFGKRGKTKGLNGGLFLRMPMSTTTTIHTLGLANSYGVIVSHINTYTSRALWDGHVREHRAHPFTCGSSGISDQYWFTRRNSTLGYTKESGQSVKAVGSIGVAGLSAQVSTSWGKGVMQHYAFDLKSEPGFYYCLGGRNGSWLTGDKVGISTFPKRSSEPCKIASMANVHVVMAADDPGFADTTPNARPPGC